MASLMDNLVEVLELEQTQYERLCELGLDKKRFIISAEAKGVEEVTELEQQVTGILRNLEIKRNEILLDIATVLGKNTKDLTITKLIGYLDQQPLVQKQLSEVKENLLVTGKKMQDINKQNEDLLQQALEMVEFDLTLFKSLRQAPETANYNKDAYNTGDLLGGQGFDTKQ